MKQFDRKIPQVAILLDPSSGWARKILKGILSYANEVGPWHVWINSKRNNSLEDIPKGWRGDGVITRIDTPKLAGEIKKMGLHAVDVSDCPLPDPIAPCIRTDDRASTRMAAQHFLDRGLRNIAFVGPTNMPNPVWYAKAFEEAVESHGLSLTALKLQKDQPNLHETITEWLQGLTKPVGVLVWGHGYARAVVDCCMAANISVPHDVAVLSGSYDELLSHACFPSLSGVLGPTETIGYQAAKTLHRQMKGETVPIDVTYIPPLGVMDRLSTDTLAVRDPKLLQVVSYIREHAFEPITTDDILRAVPMARRSLERHFQQAFGHSPVDEIRRIRIDKARRLLAETDMQMQNIAEVCGYATYNYLTHVFKKTTGMTPRDYRKQFRSQGQGASN
ncbi:MULTISPECIES: DNA-binding transcriptional regulator [unclassified Lentimonas]|uniref:AraC family transcriptional regulator n=1 Tax=unclassified Lentimonas TaxID=2630993 RepID=UPI001324CC4E|nr:MULTISPECIES: DNA-binding transcriptional regulator [unclassified Lentimonas]CAA6696522.1 Unannotated [Lentimonas sp. CC19]CAA6696669.1 Unannotated [Lentimonas sp. CC10]CAA7072449.1 Unannotated [Lentimonas sp. CC11]